MGEIASWVIAPDIEVCLLKILKTHKSNFRNPNSYSAKAFGS